MKAKRKNSHSLILYGAIFTVCFSSFYFLYLFVSLYLLFRKKVCASGSNHGLFCTFLFSKTSLHYLSPNSYSTLECIYSLFLNKSSLEILAVAFLRAQHICVHTLTHMYTHINISLFTKSQKALKN